MKPLVSHTLSCVSVVIWITLSFAQGAEASELIKPGVVIENFDDEFSGARKAGLQKGDVLLHWFRGEASGELKSPFDLSLVITDELPRGPVKFDGFRGADRRAWTVIKEYWGATTRPNLSVPNLVAYHEAIKMVEAGHPLAATARWQLAADDEQGSQFPWLAPWFFLEEATALTKTHHWKEADDAYQEAIAQSTSAGTLTQAQLLNVWGLQLYMRGDWDRANTCFEQALTDSMETDAGNLTADVLDHLGIVAKGRGDLGHADYSFSKSLEIRQKLEPGRLSVGSALLNRGLTWFDRGDVANAERYFLQALTVYEKRAPHSVGTAFILNDLGEVARLRGDLDRAEQYLRKSLRLEREIDPGTSGYASILKSLATTLEERGNHGEAEKYLRQSIAVQEKLAPGSLDNADARQSLGNLARHHFDFNAAEQAYLQSLAIRQEIAPEGLDMAETLHSLGDLAVLHNDLAKGKSYYQRALAIREKLAPKTADCANTLAALAGIARHEGDFDKATSYYEQALEASEGQSARIGGSADMQAGFRAKHQDCYREYINLLVSQNKPELAFQVLERSRARSLLEMLAEAHVDIHKGVAPGLLELDRSLQSEITAKINRRINLLTEKHREDSVAAVTKEIEDLVSQDQQVKAQIRMSSPGYASLTQPKPLSAKEVQEQLLDPKTLLLEYSLGEERSYVWAVRPGSIAAYEIPKRAEIEEVARRLYRLVTVWKRGRVGRTLLEAAKQRTAHFKETAALLSRMILSPVASELEGKRLIIVSDGALQYVPFAALPRPEEKSAKKATYANDWVPLAADHEIVILPSASVLAVLRTDYEGRKQALKTVAVLADPVFDKEDERVEKGSRHKPDHSQTSSRTRRTPDRLVRSMQDVGARGTRGLRLPRLSFTRREARAIMAITPKGSGSQMLDFDANLATATSPELAQYRIVHIATHGLLDSKRPELSGLVLSMVDRQGRPTNGFLGLQDIYNLNLPVDLVVLSACETGLGKEIQSEGLIGLTRGFMYAGASRVVASLWKADDAATAQLMELFYKAMEQEGMRPAAALRQAQVKIWKQKRWTDPYYWAAFQIQGEWK